MMPASGNPTGASPPDRRPPTPGRDSVAGAAGGDHDLGRGVLLATFLFAAGAVAVERLTLIKTQLLTGPALFALLALLAAYGARRSSFVRRRFSATGWRRIHFVAGAATLLLYAAHAGAHIPTGQLETALAGSYLVLVASGYLGAWIDRRLIRRASSRGDDEGESLPIIRRRLQLRLDQIMAHAVAGNPETPLAVFHRTRLAPFFDGPHHFWAHLLDTRGPRQRLLGELTTIVRELPVEARGIGDEIAGLVRLKDDLDDQSAVRLALRGWLFLHAPLTYVLLLLALLHGTVARAFWGGGG